MPVTPRIALPADVQGLWFPFDEASGSVVTDRVQGIEGAASNVTWTAGTRGSMPLAANSSVTVPGDDISELFRLDTLDGHLIVYCDLDRSGGTPSANSYMWSYGDPTNGTDGGLGALILTGLTTGMVFGQKGGLGSRIGGGNLTALINATFTTWNSYCWIFTRLDGGQVIGDGYFNGFHSRSAVYFDMAGKEVGAVPDTTGLRIGARASGSGSTEYLGATLNTPKLRNFVALRVYGDYRHRINGIARNLHNTLRIGELPRIMRGTI